MMTGAGAGISVVLSMICVITTPSAQAYAQAGGVVTRLSLQTRRDNGADLALLALAVRVR